MKYFSLLMIRFRFKKKFNYSFLSFIVGLIENDSFLQNIF